MQHWGAYKHCCCGKAITVTYSEYVCVYMVLGIQYAKHMRCVALSFVPCLALPYFSTLSHKWHDFWKKLLNIICVSISETFLTLRRSHWNTIINVHRCLCKVPVSSSYLYKAFYILYRFSKNTEVSYFMKILPVEISLFLANRQKYEA
jgi:hypothetical protein